MHYFDVWRRGFTSDGEVGPIERVLYASMDSCRLGKSLTAYLVPKVETV